MIFYSQCVCQHGVNGSLIPDMIGFAQEGQPWSDLVAAVGSFLEIRKGARTNDIISLILFDNSARITCKAMPLADLQSKLGDFLNLGGGGGTQFGPALSCALNVIGEVHQQNGYPPLLMLMADGGSSVSNTDGETEMVSCTLLSS